MTTASRRVATYFFGHGKRRSPHPTSIRVGSAAPSRVAHPSLDVGAAEGRPVRAPPGRHAATSRHTARFGEARHAATKLGAAHYDRCDRRGSPRRAPSADLRDERPVLHRPRRRRAALSVATPVDEESTEGSSGRHPDQSRSRGLVRLGEEHRDLPHAGGRRPRLHRRPQAARTALEEDLGAREPWDRARSLRHRTRGQALRRARPRPVPR